MPTPIGGTGTEQLQGTGNDRSIESTMISSSGPLCKAERSPVAPPQTLWLHNEVSAMEPCQVSRWQKGLVGHCRMLVMGRAGSEDTMGLDVYILDAMVQQNPREY